MADILIKNMEMPKGEDTNVYLIIGSDGIVLEKIGSMYHVTTEAVELPEHGRLVDADAIIEVLKRYCGGCDNYNGIRCKACWVDDAIGYVDDADVLVEASK